MAHLQVETINEYFGTNEIGEEIGYGEKGIIFNEVNSENLEDFHQNAEIGQCSEINNEIHYKVYAENRDDVVAFIIDENGEIEEM